MPVAAIQDGEHLPQGLEELFLEHSQMVHRTAVNLAINVLRARKRRRLVDGIRSRSRSRPGNARTFVDEMSGTSGCWRRWPADGGTDASRAAVDTGTRGPIAAAG